MDDSFDNFVKFNKGKRWEQKQGFQTLNL
jgi:hypothetical protein